MVEYIELHTWGIEGLQHRASWRYQLLHRIGRATAKAGVTWLAFGIGEDRFALLMDGDATSIANVMRGIKVGTTREAKGLGFRLRFVETVREAVLADLEAAVARVHRVGVVTVPDARGPLASPWTSHRDLLGFRAAPFFSAAPIRRRVRPAMVHGRMGGGRLPDGWPELRQVETLETLLRVSAAVVGTVAADPKCFSIFAQTAKAQGYRTEDIGRALAVTPRRVRQLLQRRDPRSILATCALGDARLRVVP